MRRETGAALGAAALIVLVASSAHGAATATRADAARSHRQIRVGGFPTGIAVNTSTDAVYVGNGTTGTLSLINGKTCNADDTRGCGHDVTAVKAGADPIGIAVDEATNTVYVVNISGTVAIVDGRTCDAATTSGCRADPAIVHVGVNPQFLAVDESANTIYVANVDSNTVSVIDGRTCNGASRAGCDRPRATIPVGPGPFTLAVNDVTHSIYVTDPAADTVSVIDGKTCNATNLSGCRKRPVTVAVGQTPGGIAVDVRTDTIYVTGEFSDDVSVIDGRTCNATTTRGCRRRPLHVLAGAGARGIAVDEATDTVYVANTFANTVSVINGAICNAAVRTGCDQHAALAPVGLSPRRVAVDELTHTVYVTNAGSNTVSMLDGRTCNGRVHAGCAGASASGHSTSSNPGQVPAVPTPTQPAGGSYTAEPFRRG